MFNDFLFEYILNYLKKFTEIYYSYSYISLRYLTLKLHITYFVWYLLLFAFKRANWYNGVTREMNDKWCKWGLLPQFKSLFNCLQNKPNYINVSFYGSCLYFKIFSDLSEARSRLLSLPQPKQVAQTRSRALQQTAASLRQAAACLGHLFDFRSV